MLDQLRRDITTRLDELVGEADKLRHALIALGARQRNGAPATAPRSSTQTPRQSRAKSPTATTGHKRTPATAETTATPARSPARTSRPTTTKPASQASPRAAPGATKTAVLAALAGGKAMTAGEVATKTGLGSATVSTTLSRLAKTGEITKANRGYQANHPTNAASPDGAGTTTPK